MSTPTPDPERREDQGAGKDGHENQGAGEGGRDFDDEFAQILGAQGLPVGAGGAQEPSGDERSARREPQEGADASPRAPRPTNADDDDDDEQDVVLLGDFVPPDPDLPQASDATVWSWAALLGGVLLTLLAAVLDSIPTWLGVLGGAAAVGGLVALLLRVPTDRSGPEDGAQV